MIINFIDHKRQIVKKWKLYRVNFSDWSNSIVSIWHIARMITLIARAFNPV